MRVEHGNRAKDLIADLMIAVYGVTARFLTGHGQPSLRALDAFLSARRAADPAGFEQLSLTVVKLLASGAYMGAPADAPPARHFGLAVSDYVHSTARNRRYFDR